MYGGNQFQTVQAILVKHYGVARGDVQCVFVRIRRVATLFSEPDDDAMPKTETGCHPTAQRLPLYARHQILYSITVKLHYFILM